MNQLVAGRSLQPASRVAQQACKCKSLPLSYFFSCGALGSFSPAACFGLVVCYCRGPALRALVLLMLFKWELVLLSCCCLLGFLVVCCVHKRSLSSHGGLLELCCGGGLDDRAVAQQAVTAAGVAEAFGVVREDADVVGDGGCDAVGAARR